MQNFNDTKYITIVQDIANENNMRPKCSISPINIDINTIYESQIEENLNKIDIKYFAKNNHCTNLPIQSTPNKNQLCNVNLKKRVNFHDVSELAESSRKSSSNFDNSSGYFSASISDSPSYNFNCKENNAQLIMTTNSVRECKRKQRTQINKYSRSILENAYLLNKYPNSNEIESLCNMLGFDENVIRIWFQNKRARDITHKKTRK